MASVKELQPATDRRYLNRELSWIRFNARVLAEAENSANPLLERLRFLSIVESNFDEFFMVRVSGLVEQHEAGILEISPDGLMPREQLKAISDAIGPLRRRASEVFERILKPEMEKNGIVLRKHSELTPRQALALKDYYQREIFKLCTPLVLHPPQSVPFISNRSLNLAVELSAGTESRLARVKIPDVAKRCVRISPKKHEYVLLEDLISSHLGTLFPGVKILGAHLFRVIRDAELEIRELEASDLITSIEETIKRRRFGDAVVLEYQRGMPASVKAQLMAILNLDEEDFIEVDGILGLDALNELAAIDKPSLRFPTHVPFVHDALGSPSSLFETISQGDVLVHHPYDGFRPVETFVASAASDPAVVGIKQTLYRVGSESPVVERLADAAEAGKQVTAAVELKARFDETNNIVWARALERAGAHVTFGFAEMKTHCKLCLIVRREPSGLKAYAHIGTGNYNPTTARQYTDLGLFTCDSEITQDISELFNLLTGFSRQTEFRRILVAPLNLREGILERIRREAEFARRGKKASIILKLNSLVDPEVIDELYAANQAGVEIDLIIRGICCLRPGVAGMSDRVRVFSIIGRFLEHSRIYWFDNNGSPDVLIGSADAMRRNLDRRVEVLVTVTSQTLISHIREGILDPYLADNVSCWVLNSDGAYAKRERRKGERIFEVQKWLMENPTTKALFGRSTQQAELPKLRLSK